MSSRASVLSVLAVSAIGGAGTMTVELSAVRLLAPWFGSSLVVWSNVIAVVLLALAVGYLVGGRLSGRERPLRSLGWMLGAAAVATALLPLLSGPVAERFLPEGLTLGEAAEVVKWGSLAASLLLFLVPAALLGTVAPLAVEAVQELEQRSAGHAGGAVLCASTLGSLVGVFGTSHVFLPVFGLTGTFRLAAAFLLAAAVLALLLSRSGARGIGAAGVAAILCVGSALGDARRPELAEGLVEIAHVESPYQSVRVVEDTRDPLTLLRYLQVNEGFDSYQSVWQPDPGLLPAGYYYNDFVLPPWWSEAQGTWKLLVLGLGAGTAVRVMEGAMPAGLALEATGVELDPVVVDLARAHMDLAVESAEGRSATGDLDARVALHNLDEQFDQIILDCYANQVEIPAHLCTREFFEEARERLTDGGWLVANLGGFGFDDPVVAAVADTCAVAFEAEVLLLRVPRARNFTLMARKGAPLPLSLENGQEAPALLAVGGEPAALVAPRGLPGAWVRVRPEDVELALTDDRCPIERLQLASIEEGARRLREGRQAGGVGR